MASFLEKLKKGMGVEELESTKTPTPKKEPKQEKKETPVKKTITKTKVKKATLKPEVKKEEKVEKETTQPAPVLTKEKKEQWPQLEGELAVDVYQTDSDLIIQSAIAGIKPTDIDISIDDDVITLKGERKRLADEEGDYFYQECYWGPFSRQIISPVEIDSERVDATLKEGILTIKIPKITRNKKSKIVVKG
ncbi:MAG: Hsp20/alpha crystallin family protein [Patescibacteria group bacterium]|nr:Hsp20/alpha crystallin family protein [Patescibacteria group bacterium]